MSMKNHCDQCDKVVKPEYHGPSIELEGHWHGVDIDGIWCDEKCFLRYLLGSEDGLRYKVESLRFKH